MATTRDRHLAEAATESHSRDRRKTNSISKRHTVRGLAIDRISNEMTQYHPQVLLRYMGGVNLVDEVDHARQLRLDGSLSSVLSGDGGVGYLAVSPNLLGSTERRCSGRIHEWDQDQQLRAELLR